MKLELGNMLSGPGQQFVVDPGVLVDTRLLLTANSGGGKSWAARKLIEEVHGKVQVIILDPEGEFGTLREKFDFVLAGKGGDIPAEPRHAGLMARKAMELGMDLIVDLYELHPRERIQFLRRFLEGLDQLPKDLWHPVLVLVDEAHIFAPEQGSAESADAMAALVSRGRKRGLGAVLLTQRLSKLAKDVAAECRNKLIGLANLDLDRKRGADELGFTDKAQVLLLRDLAAGQFYAVGPAFPKGVNAVRIGQVKTSHPKAGAHKAARPPAPSAKVKAALSKLADLPKEAEQEAKTLTELQAQVRTLKGQLQAKEREIVAPRAAQAPTEAILKRLSEEATRSANLDARQRIKLALEEYQERMVSADQTFAREAKEAFNTFRDQVWKPWAAIPLIYKEATSAPALKRAQPTIQPPKSAPESAPGDPLDNNQQKILDTTAMLIQRGFEPDRVMVARWMGIHPSGGRYGTNLALLREKGLVEERGAKLTQAGQDAATPMRTGFDEFRKVLDGSQQQLVDVLEKERDREFSREEMAAALNIHPSGGRYGTNLALLRAMGAIPERGAIKLVPQIFN